MDRHPDLLRRQHVELPHLGTEESRLLQIPGNHRRVPRIRQGHQTQQHPRRHGAGSRHRRRKHLGALVPVGVRRQSCRRQGQGDPQLARNHQGAGIRQAALRQHDPGRGRVERRLQQQGLPRRRSVVDQQRHLDLCRRQKRPQQEGDRRGHGPRAVAGGASRQADRISCLLPDPGDDLFEIPAGLQGAHDLPAGSGSIQQVAGGLGRISDPPAQCLRQEPGLDVRSQEHDLRRSGQAHADCRRPGLGRREGSLGACRFHRPRHVRQRLHRPRRCQGRDQDRRASGDATLPLRVVAHAGGAIDAACPVPFKRCDCMAVAVEHAPTPVRNIAAWDRLKVNRDWLGLWFMLPAAAFLLLFLAYPLGLGIWLSFTDARIGRGGEFIGLENYEWLWDDSVFWLSVFNTLLYTGVASVFKFAIGLYLALLLNHNMPFKAIIRAIVLIPFIVPTVLSAIAFWWIFDSQFSIVSWSLRKLGLIASNIDFLGDTWNARWSVIFANIWRGVPFIAITLLAGLQTMPASLYEAATIDGASRWQIFRYVTYPLLTPIIAVVMTFSVLFTFTDFQLIWVLTRGGPANATHLMATLGYQRAIGGGYLGEGSAIATAMIPFLLAAILISWFGLQRRKWQQGESND